MDLRVSWAAVPAISLAFLGCGGAQGPDYEPMAVEIKPRHAEVTVDDPLLLTFAGHGYQKVRWSVVEPEGGSISPKGLYTAPGREGVYHVRIWAVDNPNAQDLAEIRVHPAPVVTGLKADLTRIHPEGKVTLTAEFTGGKGVVQPGDVEVASGVGTTFRPLETTTYALHVTNPAGRVVSKTLTIAVAGPEGRPGKIEAPAVVPPGMQQVARVSVEPGARLEWQATGVDFLGQAFKPDTPVVVFKAKPGATTYQLKVRITGGAGVAAGARGPHEASAKLAALAPEDQELEFNGLVAAPSHDSPVIKLDRPFLTAGKEGYEARIANPQTGTTYSWTIENGLLPGLKEAAVGEKVTFNASRAEYVLLTCTATTEGAMPAVATTGAALVEPPSPPALQSTSQPKAGEFLWAAVQTPRPGELYRWELVDAHGSVQPDPHSPRGASIRYTVDGPGPFALHCFAETLAGDVSAPGVLQLNALPSSAPTLPPPAAPAAPDATPDATPPPFTPTAPVTPPSLPVTAPLSVPPAGSGIVPPAPAVGAAAVPPAPPMGAAAVPPRPHPLPRWRPSRPGSSRCRRT